MDVTHITVAVVLVHNNRYLMVEERCKHTGQLVFNQPAGHVEPNETIQCAAIRETLEETGCHIQLQYLLGIYSYSVLDRDGCAQRYYRFCFVAALLGHDPTFPIDSDIQAVHWLDYANINQKSLRSPLVLACVNDYRQGRRYPMTLLNEQYLLP